ncbi:hypothetical protein PCASD_06727 [Puccinia coronata f. sp. avenae]|uniref:MINDY deubiquitinase domain-containing protein n=1 Tax=Puccinia coronata f. sp. avenae TaxID=200324 RepID=A0A2N5TF48_9BASI|nr:hypothetical protein PCASD_06727 [Puccinia coronata f. sp. avenae]
MENEIKTETEQQIEKQTPTELIEITQQVTQKLLTNNDQRWWIKQILWPPFPTTRQNNSTPRQVSILMQNNNGPCSLLAICNVLLLRGSIQLPGPSTRTSISFSSLLALLSEYLIQQDLPPIQLQSALATIPITQTGLDLNPRFASIDGFRESIQYHPSPSSAPHAHGLDLFAAVRVPLVHGWIADSQDFDTWDVIVGKCGDYDKVLELVVAGEELIAKQVQEPNVDLSQEEQNLIKEALLARKFLDSTSTQLSYPGLFQLATGVPTDSLVTLLRNSHLSVLYRRPILPATMPSPTPPPLPPPPDQTDPDYDHQTALEVHAVNQQLMATERTDRSGGALSEELDDDDPNLPKLFTLVTDLAFLHEPHIVWESLEDVEGGLSEFYDWRLVRSRLTRPPRTPPDQAHQPPPLNGHSQNRLSGHNTDNDLDLAQRLQEEEYQEAARRGAPRPSQPTVPPQSGPPIPLPVPVPAPSAAASFPAHVHPVSAPAPAPAPTPTKKKKKDCVIV